MAQIEALLAQGKVQASLDRSHRLLGSQATHAEALLRLCLLYRSAALHGEALKFSDRMARLAPNAPETRSLNASCMFDAGLPDQAHGEALAALALDPENLEALRVLLKSSPAAEHGSGLEAHAETLLREGDPEKDAALVLAYLASVSKGEPFGIIHASNGVLTGIALSLSSPDVALEVELSLGAFPLARLKVDQNHPLLSVVGLPQGHAFMFRIPPELLDVMIEARLPSGKPCAGSPFRAYVDRRPEGSVGADVPGVIAGHAWLRSKPGKRLIVELEGESGRLRRVTASGFDKKLVAAGVHDGRHGFSVHWPIPEGAACETVRIREASSGQELPGSPVTVFDAGVLADAVQELNGWLRLAGERPKNPPQPPQACNADVMRIVRKRLAQWIRELRSLAAEAEER
ncbi:hypothetical protein [Fundidesulfovibrio magnetotacticus]|nr:hypothetical protein [Fundidesulfovibrio magnetotacticus]